MPREAENSVARYLLRPMMTDDGEVLVLLAFDAFDRLLRVDRIEGDSARRCRIPPFCWRGALAGGAATVLMAHHPSGAAWPSDGDVACTHDAAMFLHVPGIELTDHVIFIDSGHFSFRSARLI